MARKGAQLGKFSNGVRANFKIDGLKQMDDVLKSLGESQSKSILRKTLRELGQPIADEARDLAPIDMKRDDGPHLYEQIGVSSSLDPKHRRRMRGQRMLTGGTVQMYVGPDRKAFHAHLQEFGTEHHSAQPFMRPAWDAHKGSLMIRLKRRLWANIERRLKLNARSAARAASKGQ